MKKYKVTRTVAGVRYSTALIGVPDDVADDDLDDFIYDKMDELEEDDNTDLFFDGVDESFIYREEVISGDAIPDPLPSAEQIAHNNSIFNGGEI